MNAGAKLDFDGWPFLGRNDRQAPPLTPQWLELYSLRRLCVLSDFPSLTHRLMRTGWGYGDGRNPSVERSTHTGCPSDASHSERTRKMVSNYLARFCGSLGRLCAVEKRKFMRLQGGKAEFRTLFTGLEVGGVSLILRGKISVLFFSLSLFPRERDGLECVQCICVCVMGRFVHGGPWSSIYTWRGAVQGSPLEATLSIVDSHAFDLFSHPRWW